MDRYEWDNGGEYQFALERRGDAIDLYIAYGTDKPFLRSDPDDVDLAPELLRLAEENERLRAAGMLYAPAEGALLVRIGELEAENERLRKKSDDMLAAELVGALGLDREAIDRSGEPVGDSVLGAVRGLVQELAERSAALAQKLREKADLEAEIARLIRELATGRLPEPSERCDNCDNGPMADAWAYCPWCGYCQPSSAVK
jgi:hypothetical protein